MGRDLERQRQFTRRALILGAGKAAALALLAGRLYYLQVTQSERYLTLSDENRISLRLVAPRRGRILDRLGRPLAERREGLLRIARPQPHLHLHAGGPRFSFR